MSPLYSGQVFFLDLKSRKIINLDKEWWSPIWAKGSQKWTKPNELFKVTNRFLTFNNPSKTVWATAFSYPNLNKPLSLYAIGYWSLLHLNGFLRQKLYLQTFWQENTLTNNFQLAGIPRSGFETFLEMITWLSTMNFWNV